MIETVWSGSMKHRIFMWAGVGFLIAAFWALFAWATFPSTSERMRDIWPLISLTCPIALAGRHYAISAYAVLGANAATYALIGSVAETMRRQLHQAK